ncbi:hypothetical protein HaLaN_26279 [Haematococcus lacustris]|uniref:Uncharacterized protein n=1 Tax=Haematococcus lacustris TaxID=44745 RepID=A0A6A0A5V5_HAELA|nr:hypothetical protein HaLaN_26279 [Haematococcus lacustris]
MQAAVHEQQQQAAVHVLQYMSSSSRLQGMSSSRLQGMGSSSSRLENILGGGCVVAG